MAQRFHTEIEFTGRRPTAEQAVCLRDVLRTVDYDTPDIDAVHGMHASWRSPGIGLEPACDLIHWFGFPCRGRQWYDSEHDFPPPRTWYESKPVFSPEIYGCYRGHMMMEAIHGGLMVEDEEHGLIRAMPHPSHAVSVGASGCNACGVDTRGRDGRLPCKGAST